MHDICGALLGATLVLGQIYGRRQSEIESYDKMIDSLLPVGKLYKWFEKEYGGVRCRDVRTKTMGVCWDTKIPWQKEEALKAGMYEACSEVAGKVARRVVEMIWETLGGRK
jgi:hypothetical protein